MTPPERDRRRAMDVAPLAEKLERRLQRRRKRWAETGAALTWSQVLAGERCRGCGQAVLREHARQKDLAKELATFLQRHADCHTYRSAVEVGGVPHCGDCCPPLPIRPAEFLKRQATFREMRKRSSTAHLRAWALTLSCGHVVERTADRRSPFRPASTPWAPVYPCPTCDEKRAIVEATEVGPAEASKQPASDSPG